MPRNSPPTGDIILKSKQAIPVYPEVVRLLEGDIVTAYYYAQLLYYSRYAKSEYFAKSKTDIEHDTALTRFQQDRARAKLVRLGWIDLRVGQRTETLHFRIARRLT